MKLAAHLPEYRARAESFLQSKGLSLSDIQTGRDAWAVAHNAGIASHAYALSRDILDSHIQTALESIMPNAVFQDKKRY